MRSCRLSICLPQKPNGQCSIPEASPTLNLRLFESLTWSRNTCDLKAEYVRNALLQVSKAHGNVQFSNFPVE